MLPTGSLVRGSKNVQPRPPKADPSSYGEFFKQHIWERAQCYDSLARRVLNHNIRHTVVLHHNALNALFLQKAKQFDLQQGGKLADLVQEQSSASRALDAALALDMRASERAFFVAEQLALQ